MSWSRVPLAPLALALVGGIALAPWIPSHLAWWVLLAALAWGASLVILERLGSATAFLLLGVAAVGALRAIPLPPPPDHVARMPLPTVARVEGRLVAEPVRFAPDRVRLLLEVEGVDGEPRTGRLQVTVYGGDLPPVAEGQRIAATMRLHPATGFRNPDGFDYAASLQREGIFVVASARAERVAALEDPRPPWPVRAKRAAREVMARTLPPASAALLGGLLLGDRVDLPREIDEAFRRAGVYHVLAVSGFNVALVAGAVWALLTLARVGRRPAALGAMVAVIGFALVVGPEPSVLRAVIMGVLVLGALLLDREASVMNGLALAALVLLAVRPGDLLDPGFQLSFAATAGIVLAPLPRGLIPGALGVSVAAQLAVLPIALVHFNQLSLIGPLANLGVVPLAGVATVVGLLAVALALVTEVGSTILFDATWPILLALRVVVALAASVPAGLLHLPAPHWAAIVAYTLGLGLALLWWRLREAPSRSRLAGQGACVLLAAAIIIAAWPLIRPADGRLRLTVLDVGQGDAIVLETPHGQAALIDAGPGGPMRLDAGERVVAPFLWNHGVLRLAAAMTTHDDRDHAGGMAAVRRYFAVREELGPQAMRWIGGVRVLALDPGRPGGGSVAQEPHSARSLPPPAPAPRRNDDAVVLRIDYGLASFLLASDITAPAERDLLASGAPLRATVLKVAHHGSRSSSTPGFLERARPSFAVISVGPRNSYGHPAPEVLARLAAVGTRVYRTDRDGAVSFETDGSALTVTRWATGAVQRYCLDPDVIC
ncbi:MAG TPA: DNA internalization-related competence protein ComEC/Rec2 [Methylomirabilota bacterium]|jgi:competence protein ComEC|nr:DNA internalization-related competence protein ComEC/Rec2 [Methylomirabilota bacterium]